MPFRVCIREKSIQAGLYRVFYLFIYLLFASGAWPIEQHRDRELRTHRQKQQDQETKKNYQLQLRH